MEDIVKVIKESDLGKEYLAITEGIADIDEKLATKAKRKWWQDEKPARSNKEIVMLQAERQLLAKSLMDVTSRINGDSGSSKTCIGISVDVMLPAPKKVLAQEPEPKGELLGSADLLVDFYQIHLANAVMTGMSESNYYVNRTSYEKEYTYFCESANIVDQHGNCETIRNVRVILSKD